MPNNQAHFSRLPNELAFKIAKYLSYVGLHRLSMVNKDFHDRPEIQVLTRESRREQSEWEREDILGLAQGELNRYLCMPTGQLYDSLSRLNSQQQAMIIKRREIDREALFWRVIPRAAFLNVTVAVCTAVIMQMVMKDIVQSPNILLNQLFTIIAASVVPVLLNVALGPYGPSNQLIFPQDNFIPEPVREALTSLYQVSVCGGFFYSLLANGFADTMRGVIVGFLGLMAAASVVVLAKSVGVGAIGALPTTVPREAYYDWRTIREARQPQQAGCCARLFGNAARTAPVVTERPHLA